MTSFIDEEVKMVLKFSKQKVHTKQLCHGITIQEYCTRANNIPLDGAVAHINATLGPKINHVFTELFFVLSGKLEIEADGRTISLDIGDLAIVVPEKPHTIRGYNARVFIVCTPPFKSENMNLL